MLRPLDATLIETPTNWALFDPIIPYGVIALNSDGTGFKLGNGVDVWSDLSYQGSTSIANKQVQTSRSPTDKELLVFCASTDKWVYRLQGCIDNETNFGSNLYAVFPTFSILVETDDVTHIPTGRIKIADGVNEFQDIPWTGDTTNNGGGDLPIYGSIFDGDMIKYNSSQEMFEAVSDLGLLTKLKTVDGASSGLDADLLDGQHGSYYLPSASYTAAEILTRLKTVDGAGSGLDADTLDGHHSTAFATTADITTVDDNALAYAIAFGG